MRAKADASRTLWEMLVAEKVTTDEHILNALSDRFRLKLADLSEADLGIRGTVPEQVARKGLMPLLGQPLIARVIAQVSGLADEVFITTNHLEGYRTLGELLYPDCPA